MEELFSTIPPWHLSGQVYFNRHWPQQPKPKVTLWIGLVPHFFFFFFWHFGFIWGSADRMKPKKAETVQTPDSRLVFFYKNISTETLNIHDWPGYLNILPHSGLNLDKKLAVNNLTQKKTLQPFILFALIYLSLSHWVNGWTEAKHNSITISVTMTLKLSVGEDNVTVTVHRKTRVQHVGVGTLRLFRSKTSEPAENMVSFTGAEQQIRSAKSKSPTTQIRKH